MKYVGKAVGVKDRGVTGVDMIIRRNIRRIGSSLEVNRGLQAPEPVLTSPAPDEIPGDVTGGKKTLRKRKKNQVDRPSTIFAGDQDLIGVTGQKELLGL